MIFIRLSFKSPGVDEIWVSSQQPRKCSVSPHKNFILTLFSYGKRGKQVHNNKKFCIFELFIHFDNDEINHIWSFRAHQPVSNRLPFMMTDLMTFGDDQARGKTCLMYWQLILLSLVAIHSLQAFLWIRASSAPSELGCGRSTGPANKSIREAKAKSWRELNNSLRAVGPRSAQLSRFSIYQ